MAWKVREYVDLTSSFEFEDIYCANEVIDLVDDDDVTLEHSTKNENPKEKEKSSHKNIASSSKEVQTTTSSIGACPICLDDFGNNQLVSTKCGHVYCLLCLEQSLQVEKRCPTCRKVLKGKQLYHPIYLS